MSETAQAHEQLKLKLSEVQSAASSTGEAQSSLQRRLAELKKDSEQAEIGAILTDTALKQSRSKQAASIFPLHSSSRII